MQISRSPRLPPWSQKTGIGTACSKLKLKQASAVLGVSAKEIQNLVQLKVIGPPRRQNLEWFDGRLLLEAKVALYLKESLGTSSQLLSLPGTS